MIFCLEKRIQDGWILHDVHYVAALLHPSFKNFDKSPELYSKAIDLTKNELLKHQAPLSLVLSSELNPKSSPPKSLLSKCFDKPRKDSGVSTTPYDELEEYMALNVRLNEHDDILLFWLEHKTKFPTLFKIVQDIYAIPAANTIIERLFSSSKNTITDKRTSLGTEKVNKLLFLQKNLNLLKQIDQQSTNEVSTAANKRKMTLHASCTTLYDNQESVVTATVTKKVKMNDDDILLCEDDQENNQIDYF